MTYLDGFSGYGGFHLGLERAGFHFHKVYYSEINKYAIANYSYNFPQSIYAGSIDTICSAGLITELDMFTFGWPCQDNSIAGKRKGQTAGTRSGLLYEAVKIINKFKPRNFIAENVAGLLSVNEGIDIIESLRILTYLNESCPQYDIEMQLLNTRWVLPQNRERLYFVGHLRGSGSRQIFPIGENGSICDGLGTPEEEVHDVALTQTARQYASWNGTFVRALTETRTEEAKSIRKESQKNGRDFSPRRGKELALRNDEVMNTITTSQSKEQFILISGDSISKKGFHTDIRKLTPIECERLQGLPDNHTKYGIFEGIVQELSDTQRYKLCGNGVTADIVEMIGKKLYIEPLI